MNNNWNQNLQLGNKPTKKIPFSRPYNFIEALKDLGSGIKSQAKAASVGTLDNAVGQITGQAQGQPGEKPDAALSQPQMPFNFAEFLRSRENQIRQQERLISQQQRGVETLVFHRKEEQAKKEIEVIKTEIKKLVIETGDIATELQEAEKAVATTTVAAGIYHLNFFERVRRLIKLARKRICESKSWLQLFNSRSQDKSYYWAQVQKSGTKYMLSHERYMATQAG